MQIQLVHIKAATAGERIGTLQCLNGFIRKRIMEHLEKLEGVQNVKRIAWDIVYFETKDGFKAEDVLEAVHMIVPVFAAEMQVRRPWIRRNFWILWGTAFGIMHILNVIVAIMDGDLSFGIFSWLAGFLIVAISLMNYQIGRRREEELLAYVRQECIRIAEHLNGKEDEHEHL